MFVGWAVLKKGSVVFSVRPKTWLVQCDALVKSKWVACSFRVPLAFSALGGCKLALREDPKLHVCDTPVLSRHRDTGWLGSFPAWY